jgi:hypothetical protein
MAEASKPPGGRGIAVSGRKGQRGVRRAENDWAEIPVEIPG